MKIKIKVTKEIIRKAMWCSTNITGSTCAVAIAVRDIFPLSWVRSEYIDPYGVNGGKPIKMPKIATNFILLFDKLVDTPEKRLDLPELEFEVELSDEIISKINIDDIHKSETLEVVK